MFRMYEFNKNYDNSWSEINSGHNMYKSNGNNIVKNQIIMSALKFAEEEGLKNAKIFNVGGNEEHISVVVKGECKAKEQGGRFGFYK